MNPKFQQRHYEIMARLFGDLKIDENTINSFCEFFKEDNERFNEDKFRTAIKHYWGISFHL